MSAKYAYSLNGENYTGTYDSREAAREAALAKSSGMIDPPVSVFVAEILSGDPQLGDHATGVIEEMRRRSRELGGDDAESYLARVPTMALTELDAAFSKALSAWLEKHKLSPKSFKVGAISEHTVPLPHRGLNGGVNGEVHDLGISEYTLEARS